MEFKAVIFDLDGTLLDTLTDLANSMNKVLKKNNLPTHPVDEYRYFVGDGASTLVKRVLPFEIQDEVLFKRLLREFLEDYAQNWHVKTRLYPGIEDMLDFIVGKGIKIAVLSNKPHDFTRLCVERFLDKWEFSEIIGERPGIPRKPDPTGALAIAKSLNISPKECLYLGDTSIDMKTANSAGMFAVGVLWGFRDKSELEESGAKRIISNPLEIKEIL